MLRRYILSAAVGIAAILAVASCVNAAAGDKPSREFNVQSVLVPIWGHSQSEEANEESGRAQLNLEVAQSYYATICQTYVGPWCPLAVVLPVGAACTCYFPGGALAGVAQ